MELYNKVAEGLKDIRDTYPGNELLQDYMLRVQFPAPYHPKSIVGIPKGDQVDSTGLDALLIVIRRIISQLPMEFRDVKDEAVRRQEQANPLLRLAMADFNSTDKDILQAARYHALKGFYGGSLEDEDLSFLALAENKLMQETFWQRDDLLLLNPDTAFKVGGVWGFGTIDNVLQVAEKSLIKFTTGNLGEQIAEQFGTFISQNDTVFIKQAKPPAILRVRYDVSAADPKKFQDLRKVVVDMMHAERKPSGLWKLTEPGTALKTYCLIAEVCLSSSPRVKDTIRTYPADGEQPIPIPTSFPNHQKEPLGKANARYILYYCHGVENIPGEHLWSEILPPFDRAKANILQRALDGTDEPRPPPQASNVPSALRIHRRGGVSSQAGRDDRGQGGQQSRGRSDVERGTSYGTREHDPNPPRGDHTRSHDRDRSRDRERGRDHDRESARDQRQHSPRRVLGERDPVTGRVLFTLGDDGRPLMPPPPTSPLRRVAQRNAHSQHGPNRGGRGGRGGGRGGGRR